MRLSKERESRGKQQEPVDGVGPDTINRHTDACDAFLSYCIIKKAPVPCRLFSLIFSYYGQKIKPNSRYPRASPWNSEELEIEKGLIERNKRFTSRWTIVRSFRVFRAKE